MKVCAKIFYFTLVWFLLPAFPYNNFQVDAASVSTYPDTSRLNGLMIGTDYMSNTTSFGQISDITPQPSVSGFLNYTSKKGFIIGLSPMLVGNSDSTATHSTYELDLNIEYQWKLNKYFTISPAYSHYFFSKNSYAAKSLYNNQFTLGLNFNSKWVFAEILGYYLKGAYKDWMTTAQMGLNIQFDNVPFKDQSISFSPEINISFGNQDYYKNYTTKIYSFLLLLYYNNPSLTIGDVFNENKYPRIWRYLNNHPNVLKNFQKLDKNMLIGDLFKSSTQFNLSSIGLNFPVYYSVGSFILNFTYSIYFPQNTPSYLSNNAISYFSTGVSYIFD